MERKQFNLASRLMFVVLGFLLSECHDNSPPGQPSAQNPSSVVGQSVWVVQDSTISENGEILDLKVRMELPLDESKVDWAAYSNLKRISIGGSTSHLGTTSRWHMKEIPSWLSKLPRLEVISIRGASITNISASLSSLSKLRYFELAHVPDLQLETPQLPEWFFQLDTLNLLECGLKDEQVVELARLQNLMVLSLEGNRLSVNAIRQLRKDLSETTIYSDH